MLRFRPLAGQGTGLEQGPCHPISGNSRRLRLVQEDALAAQATTKCMLRQRETRAEVRWHQQVAQHFGAGHVAAAEAFARRGLTSAFAAPKLGRGNVLPGMGHHRKAAGIRRGVAKLVLRLRGHLAVHLALKGHNCEFEPRSEVILELLALAQIAARRLHLVRAALDVEAAEFRDTGIAPGGVSQTLRIDPEMLSILNDVHQLVEARTHGMGAVFP